VSAPVRAVFRGLPVNYVHAGRERKTWLGMKTTVDWEFWAPHVAEVSDLFWLRDGDHVWAYLNEDKTLTWNGRTIELKAPRTYFQWRDTVDWVAGHVITAKSLSWAKRVLEETGKYSILEIAGIRTVLVVPGLPNPSVWGPTGGSWGGLSASRAIVLPDVGQMPGSRLPADIHHEAIHAWQMKEGLDVGSTSQLIELSAQMGTQELHWAFDGLEAFKPGGPYGRYADLFKEVKK
jgi:hypothetical protein